jgi:WD40 repeat protein
MDSRMGSLHPLALAWLVLAPAPPTAGDWTWLVGPTGGVHAVAFAPDGARVAAGDDVGGVFVWETTGGEPQAALEGHAGRVNALAFSPDGTRLAIVGGSLLRGTGGDAGFALVREAQGGEVAVVLERGAAAAPRMVLDVAWSPDGALLATAGNDAVRLWRARTGELALELDATQPSWAVAFAPDGKLLAAAADSSIAIWNLVTRRQQATLAGHTRQVTALAFTPDGRELVSGALDHRLRVWDPATGLRRRIFEALSAPVVDFALSPDGRLITAAGDPEDFMVFDLGTKLERTRIAVPYTRAEERGIEEQVLAVRWSPDGRHVAWGLASGVVALRDLGPELGIDPRRR